MSPFALKASLRHGGAGASRPLRPLRFLVIALCLLMTVPLLGMAAVPAPRPALVVDEFRVPEDVWCKIREEWVEDLLATHPQGTWAPMIFRPDDDQLQRIGLPPADVLAGRRYPNPTMVFPDGTTKELSMEELNLAVAAYAGTGCLGIRPGAWLLLLDNGGVGWCSMAHVYGAPGNYKISTAGHCGGGVATVIAAVGNHVTDVGNVPVPILLDFGRFGKSTDGGIGNDLALIDIYSHAQHLVSPTMCFWGGPLGMYAKQGAVASASLISNSGAISPTYSVTPDPFLAQGVVHYGHGTGLGPGGTPRAGAAIHWAAGHFTFFGAISPGDSGSGTNTLGGDGVGEANEAAGINTHIFVDPSLRTGLGYLAGTRATKVGGTLALGQIVPYPAPVPGAP